MPPPAAGNIRSGQVRRTGLPKVDGNKCVHAFSYFAGCTACMDSCLFSALAMNDGSPGLDTDACKACGLCQPACPQDAIVQEHSIPIDGSQAFLVCSKVNCERETGTVTCVHSQGLEQIAGFYGKGIREFVVATANCSFCEYNAEPKFEDYVHIFNRLAESRSLTSIRITDINTTCDAGATELARWQKFVDRADVSDTGRRNFLRSFIPSPIRDTSDKPETMQRSLAAFLTQTGPLEGRELYIAVPQIDSRECTGCDACINICPQEVLTQVKADTDITCYAISAGRCTGCRLCVEVCEANAISLDFMVSSSIREIPLQPYHCRSCGAPVHVPTAAFSGDDLCRICSHTDHHGKLFQVWE